VIRPGQIVKLPEGAKVSVVAAAVASTIAVPSRLQVVLDFAKAQVGKPYEFAKAGPTSYDCSGLTKAAFAQVKVSLPHQSLLQSKWRHGIADEERRDFENLAEKCRKDYFQNVE
jgi:cell wall-associated NlpC family hydrolase